jgi:hypothetical protein
MQCSRGTDGNTWRKKENSFKEMAKFNVFTKERYYLEKRKERGQEITKGRRTDREKKARKGRKAK